MSGWGGSSRHQGEISKEVVIALTPFILDIQGQLSDIHFELKELRKDILKKTVVDEQSKTYNYHPKRT